jgi:hypothetical protein
MSYIKLKGRRGLDVFIVALLFISLLLPSCARRIAFQTSSEVPAAQGSVKIKKDRNKNYQVDLRVIRLAEPERLSPPKNLYIVWMDTEQQGTKNIGRLTTSTGLFSKKLRSSLKTVTPFTPTRFYITGEDNIDTRYPGAHIVLTTRGFY